MKTTLAGVLGALVFGMPAFACAQQGPGDTTIPSLEYQQADVREALRALFKDVGTSYSIAPEVQGTITVSLKNVPFETALQNILRQVDATYRVTGGVYEIIKRTEDPDVFAPEPPTNVPNNHVIRTIKIRSADPALIALLLSKSGQSYNGSPEITSLGRFISVGGGSFGGGTGSGVGGGFGNQGGTGRGQGSGFGNQGFGSGNGTSGGGQIGGGGNGFRG